ncbi:serine hydrolase domain-containing protein [Chryseobacterium viscerum]|uniref:serine hydrolase domain-containing protein n=1 Tax=Chryseobacterium viscerum TaxID=1037377 RepID=UPI00222194FE|nr:serine hydrolase domain-containing protein [Chryseobacterium viscerum]MCW1963850.1 beta-lactamase family protein [Chryseobacterium viscerum]
MKTITNFFCLALFLSFFWSFSQNQNILQDKNTIKTDNPLKSELDLEIDQYVKKYYEDPKAVGLSIGITIKGKDYYYNYGELEYGKQVLPNNKTIYEIGSITKTFTGILTAQAILDKKIRTDDDIRKYLPEKYPNLQYNNHPIKIIHLANHTSRITRIFPNLYERQDYIELNPFSNYSKKMFYEGLKNMKMDTLPGVKYTYSNMAVNLLGYILEDVYHENYFSLVRKYILKPLQMNSTTVSLADADKNNIAKAHNNNREVTPYWDFSELVATGELRSNTNDMIKYIKANIAEKQLNISLSHKYTFEGEEGSLGLNWFFHTTKNGNTMYEHTGGTGGSRSSLEFFPGLQSGFIILTNNLANRKILEKDLSAFVEKISSK